jgi:hypothetical protein
MRFTTQNSVCRSYCLLHYVPLQRSYNIKSPSLITFCLVCLSSKMQQLRTHEHVSAGTLTQTATSSPLLAVQSGQIKLAVTLRRAKEQTKASTFLSLCLRYYIIQLLRCLFMAPPADETNSAQSTLYTHKMEVPVHVIQAYTDRRGTAPLIPGRTSVISFTSGPPYHSAQGNRRIFGPLSHTGCYEENNYLLNPGVEHRTV